MSARQVKFLLPPASPAAAVYAALGEPESPLSAPPFQKKRLPPVGHQQARRPRQLSDKQRRTFLGEAASRIKAEATQRTGKYLRRLDTIHESGRRSRSELWSALGAVNEPFLARLDVATGCLGWLDEHGRFRLNRQGGIAEDAGISAVAICRLFKALEKAGYILRKLKRIYRNGKNWVTRVTVYVRPCFFNDLGLGLAHANARTVKSLAYLKKRRRIEAQQQQERLDEVGRAHERRISHRQAEARREDQTRQSEAAARVEQMRQRAERISELRVANPELSDAEVKTLYRQRYPAP